MILPVILDTLPAYLRSSRGASSLLLAPTPDGVLLTDLVARVRGFTADPIRVLPTFTVEPLYSAAIQEVDPRASVLSAQQLEELILSLEPSDLVMLIDPSWSPSAPLELWRLTEANRGDAARHLIALERSGDGAREYVHVDADGAVDRIQRYYDGVTRLRTVGVLATLAPVGALRASELLQFASLTQLRALLAVQGAPTRDLPVNDICFNLGERSGYLAYRQALDRDRRGVTLGANCRIDPSARLVGDVVVHDNSVIDSDAVVIGPALIGRGARIGAGAVVAQSVVLPRCVVGPGDCARHTVVGDSVEALRETSAFFESPDAPLSADSASARWRPFVLRAKRMIDTFLAIVGLIALSPLLLIAALGVRLSSRGRVLFGHDREGLNGRPFRCWKFRTMVADAHLQQRSLYAKSDVDGPQFKIESDPRVTRLGAMMRACNVDELPQLFNVVMGQMSLIGPRPSPFRENQVCLPWRQARLSVRPGITGLWQICRYDRSTGDFHQWIYYDMLYVRHMSLWLDLKIMLATLLTGGGRFSVPLTWMISGRLLREDADLEDVDASQTPSADPLAPEQLASTEKQVA